MALTGAEASKAGMTKPYKKVDGSTHDQAPTKVVTVLINGQKYNNATAKDRADLGHAVGQAAKDGSINGHKAGTLGYQRQMSYASQIAKGRSPKEATDLVNIRYPQTSTDTDSQTKPTSLKPETMAGSASTSN